MTTVPTLRELMEAGVHFGHTKGRKHPKADEFIFTTRDNVNIINLENTQKGLEKALKFLEELGSQGKNILFVGTKRQVKSIITEICGKAEIPYVAERWIGGLLTNFSTVQKSINMLIDLGARKEAGEFNALNKQEQSKIDRRILKLKTNFDGVKNLKRVPDALFIVDIASERTAVREANSLNIPVIALVDTNADPNLVQYSIPANDDATKALEILINLAVLAFKESKSNKVVKKEEAIEGIHV